MIEGVRRRANLALPRHHRAPRKLAGYGLAQACRTFLETSTHQEGAVQLFAWDKIEIRSMPSHWGILWQTQNGF